MSCDRTSAPLFPFGDAPLVVDRTSSQGLRYFVQRRQAGLYSALSLEWSLTDGLGKKTLTTVPPTCAEQNSSGCRVHPAGK
mmetsp:Transcript_15005/g.34673  ORF Transcript_15005/g.34673 Transcript_15005/m.34673 type:complete len:81 (+) Transcript_15005:291-533(+)